MCGVVGVVVCSEFVVVVVQSGAEAEVVDVAQTAGVDDVTHVGE